MIRPSGFEIFQSFQPYPIFFAEGKQIEEIHPTNSDNLGGNITLDLKDVRTVSKQNVTI